VRQLGQASTTRRPPVSKVAALRSPRSRSTAAILCIIGLIRLLFRLGFIGNRDAQSGPTRICIFVQGNEGTSKGTHNDVASKGGGGGRGGGSAGAANSGEDVSMSDMIRSDLHQMYPCLPTVGVHALCTFQTCRRLAPLNHSAATCNTN